MSEQNEPVVGVDEDGTIKLDLRPNATQEPIAEEAPVQEEPAIVEEAPVEDVAEEQPVQEAEPAQEVATGSMLQEIIDEEIEVEAEKLQGDLTEAIVESLNEGVDLPDNIQKVVDFMDETGGTLEDYVKLNTDYSSLNEDQLLREYYETKYKAYDREDIDFLLNDKFSYDEELDDESDVRKTKLAKKKIIAKANRFFKEQQELYKQPLESSGSSNEANEELQAYKQYLNTAKTQQEEANRKREWFVKKSDEVFGSEFKGFKFKLNDEEIMFSPGGASELKKAQETPMNFVHKYMDSQGLLNDAEGYHRSLAMAMNPDKFAQFFFEQGKSKATEDVIRKTKNINMSERKAPEVSTKGGMQVKSISEPSGNRLRIKSVKRT